MSLSRKQYAILNVAKKKLGLTEGEYRAILARVAGVTSAKELDRGGFEAIMGLFDYLGFGAIRAPGENFGTRKGMASYAQIELIRALFAEWSGTPEAEGLETWLHHKFHVSSLRFLTARDAGKAITALKAMKARRYA